MGGVVKGQVAGEGGAPSSRAGGRISGAARRVAAFAPFALAIGALNLPVADYYGGQLRAFQILPALFVAAPLFDLVVGDDKARRNAGTPGRIDEFRVLLWLWVALILSLQFWALRIFAGGGVDATEAGILVVSVALITSTFGIPVAHELMHRPSRLDRGLAELLMCSVSYPFWCVSHVFGHHRHVATPQDPATARLGESFYSYLPRATLMELRLVAGFEAARMRRLGRSPLDYRGRLARYAVELALVYGAVGLAFGGRGLLFVLVLSAISTTLLHLMNYVQHYGLMRAELRPGVFEPIGPQHAWNTAARYSNASLLNLGRHSDHHMAATREYQRLQHLDQRAAPVLPVGIPVLFLMALAPPVWFAFMNPRVAEARRAAAARPDRSGDRHAELERLAEAMRSGSVAVDVAHVSKAARRAVVNDRVNRFGGWLLAVSLLTFIAATVIGGIVAAYALLLGMAVAMVLVRQVLRNAPSDAQIVAWAAEQPWNWSGLWFDSDVTLRTGSGEVCRSLADDWTKLAPVRAGMAA